MKLQTLFLRGSIGVRDGLGLDEIKIDFTRFEPGLIAIIGRNGSGKTSIMESCTPYRRLISREGALSQHFFLRDSVRELEFTIAGAKYKSRIIIDAHTGKQEAYLYENGVPLSDGKTSSYDEQIEKLLGTFDLFAKSIFSCQNAESITSLTAGKRKELFIELLGLQRYELYAEHAKNRADEQEKDLYAKRGAIDRVTGELADRDRLAVELERGQGKLAALATHIATAELKAEEARALMVELDREVLENVEKEKRLHVVEEDMAELRSDREKVERDARQEMEGINTKVTAVQAEITRKREIISHADEINEHVDALLTLRIEEKDLAVTKGRLHQVEQEEASAKLAYQKANSEHTQAVVNQKHKVQLREKERDGIHRDWQLDIGEVKRKLQEAKQSSELINKVPFGQRCVEAGCEFVAAAVEAGENIPLMEKNLVLLNEKPDVLTTVERELAASESVLADLLDHPPINGADFTAKKAAFCYDAGRHDEVLRAIGELEKKRWDQLQKELEVAQAVVNEKEGALAEYRMQLENLAIRTKQRLDDLDAKIQEKDRLAAEIEGSISDTIQGRHAAMEKELSHLIEEVNEMREQRQVLTNELAVLESQFNRMQGLQSELELLGQEVGSLEGSTENWRLVQRACGKDGIPALELDAAGPEVSRIANDLLSSTFGSRFQIAFETTKLSKDRKKMMETFEIRVYGEEGEKRIEDLSGGQRVWIEKAIQEAIAIYLSEKSGREYQTSYADEADGALDPDNKQHFLAMLRESFKLGRRHFTFLITQTPEIWAQVQQRIILHPGSSSIECVY